MGVGFNWQFYRQELPVELYEKWNRLCDDNPRSCASSFPVFVEESKVLLNNSKQVIYAFAYQNDELVCAIPLFSKIKRICLFIDIEVLQMINHDHLDFHTIAGQHLWDESILLQSFVSAIQTQLVGWHYFQGRNLNLGKSYQGLYSLPSYDRKTAYFNVGDVSSIDDIMPKKLLKNINRHQKKLMLDGKKLHLECTNTVNDINNALLYFLKIEDSGWKGESNTSISSNKDTCEFYTNFCNEYAKTGKAQIYLLYLDETAIAGAISFKHDKIIYLHKIAYLDDLKASGPGSILVKMILEYTVQKDLVSSVCLNSNPKWVDRWHPKLITLNAIECFNINLKGKILYQLFSLHKYIKNL